MSIKNYYIVTGSSSGLGKDLVKNLKQGGFKTIGIDRVDGEHTDLNIDLAKISYDDIKKIKTKLVIFFLGYLNIT